MLALLTELMETLPTLLFKIFHTTYKSFILNYEKYFNFTDKTISKINCGL